MITLSRKKSFPVTSFHFDNQGEKKGTDHAPPPSQCRPLWLFWSPNSCRSFPPLDQEGSSHQPMLWLHSASLPVARRRRHTLLTWCPWRTCLLKMFFTLEKMRLRLTAMLTWCLVPDPSCWVHDCSDPCYQLPPTLLQDCGRDVVWSLPPSYTSLWNPAPPPGWSDICKEDTREIPSSPLMMETKGSYYYPVSNRINVLQAFAVCWTLYNRAEWGNP